MESCFAIDGLLFCCHGDTRMDDFLDCTIFFMFLFRVQFIFFLVDVKILFHLLRLVSVPGTRYFILGLALVPCGSSISRVRMLVSLLG